MEAKRYKAFISYSHASDATFAAQLQIALQRFAKPWNRIRSFRVFRDQTNLSVAPSLWSEIASALSASEHLLLLASPACARSKWITRELKYWITHASTSNLVIIVTSGRIEWDDVHNDFDLNRSTCLPEILRGAFRESPLYVDCSDLVGEGQTSRASLDDPKFLDAVATIAARLHGREKDEIFGEHIRQHRKIIRLAWSAASALLVLAIAAAIGFAIAIRASNEAERRAISADARRLALEGAVSERAEAQPDLAILLALQSLKLEPSAGAYKILLTSLSAMNEVEMYLRAPGRSLRALAFSTNNRHVYALSDQDTVLSWDLDHSQRPLSPAVGFREQGGAFMSGAGPEVLVAFEGQLAAVDRISRTVAKPTPRGVTISRLSGEALATIPIQEEGVAALALSPGARILATGAPNGQITLWNAHTGKKIGRELEYPSGENDKRAVRALAIGPGAKQLAAGYEDGALVLWNLTGRVPSARLLERLYSEANRLLFDHNGARLLVAFGHSVAVWDLETLRSKPLLGSIGLVQDVTFSADELRIAAASQEVLVVWTLAEHSTLYRAFDSPHTASVVAAAVLSDGRTARTLDYDGLLVTWDFSEMPATSTEEQLPVEPGSSAVLSRDGFWLMTLEKKGRELVCWDLSSLPPAVATRASLAGEGLALALNAEGNTVAVTFSDGGFAVYQIVQRQARLKSLAKSTEPLFRLALDGSGTWLAGAYESEGIFVRNLADGREWSTRSGHAGMVTGLAFNRDSTLLATGGMDQRVGLWHLPNLFPKGELRKGHSGTGHTVVMFNPRTDQLISSGSDALILLWPSAGDAAEALGLVGHELPAYTLAFTQDGERLLAGDNDKKVFLWSVDPAFWRDRAYALANRDFTPDERRAYRLSAR